MGCGVLCCLVTSFINHLVIVSSCRRLLSSVTICLLHFPSQEGLLSWEQSCTNISMTRKPLIVGRVKNRLEKIDTRNESYVYTGIIKRFECLGQIVSQRESPSLSDVKSPIGSQLNRMKIFLVLKSEYFQSQRKYALITRADKEGLLLDWSPGHLEASHWSHCATDQLLKRSLRENGVFLTLKQLRGRKLYRSDIISNLRRIYCFQHHKWEGEILCC